MENIYSTLAYQKLCEVPSMQIIEQRLFKSMEPQNFIFGLRSHSTDFYGLYAPFWLPNFMVQHSKYEKLESCLTELIELTKMGGETKKIKVRLPPHFYNNSIEMLNFIMEKYGFTQVNNALWQMIYINDYEFIDHYEEGLRHSARKVLKKTYKKEVILTEIFYSDQKKISFAYDLINENRKKNNAKIRYSKNYLIKLMLEFGAHIKIFTLEIDAKIVAAAICHKTTENIMYVASWGDHGHDLGYSPMYKFASELVQYCIEKKYKYLDFGVSSDKQTENLNLLQFKKNIGCNTTSQTTFVLEFGNL